MRKDISKNLGVMFALAPAVYEDSNTPAAIDIGNFAAAILVLAIGVGGITFTADNKIVFKLTHSVDNSTYEAVAQEDVKGVTVGEGGVVKSLVAAHAAASVTKVGYHGGRRYLKLLAEFSGTHATGTPIAAVVVAGEPYVAPVA